MRPILQKYKKLGARKRKMAEDIEISDTRPILIKYDKLEASSRKMADDFMPRFNVYTD